MIEDHWFSDEFPGLCDIEANINFLYKCFQNFYKLIFRIQLFHSPVLIIMSVL